MKKLITGVCLLSALFLSSCGNGNTDNVNTLPEHKTEPGKVTNTTVGIVGRGVMNSDTRMENSDAPVAFTDENIELFNSVTREIRFRDMEPGKDLVPYEKIEFHLDDEILFTAATIVSDINSQIFNDLVLYVDRAGGNYRYYLNDAYPIWAADSDEAKANAAARAENWAKFLEHLRKDNRLREYDDSDPGNGTDPGGNNPDPYIPDTPHHNTGDIELLRFTQNAKWFFVELEPNTLNVVRNEDELKALITGASYVASGIDFERYTLLLVRVCTSNGIHEIFYALQGADNGYAYTMKVLMNDADVIGDEICAALAPIIDPNESVSFDFTATRAAYE